MSAGSKFHVKLVVISGPSGSGKSTVVDRVVDVAPIKLVKAVSATTRPPRRGEVEGVDYYFLTTEDFEALRQSGQFIECAEVHSNGNWYGTLTSEIERAHAEAGWAFLEIDVQGAQEVMRQFPDALTVFLTTPSEAEYEKRLRARGTESESAIRERLETASDELQRASHYRYTVVNDDLDQAVDEICHIIASAKENPCTTN